MQAAEEVAAEIERAIRDASSKVDSFVAAQALELSRALAEHEASMRELEGKIARLKSDHGGAAERGASLQAVLSQERVRLAERQGEAARLEASAASLPAEVDTARAKEEAAQRQHAGARQGALRAREREKGRERAPACGCWAGELRGRTRQQPPHAHHTNGHARTPHTQSLRGWRARCGTSSQSTRAA